MNLFKVTVTKRQFHIHTRRKSRTPLLILRSIHLWHVYAIGYQNLENSRSSSLAFKSTACLLLAKRTSKYRIKAWDCSRQSLTCATACPFFTFLSPQVSLPDILQCTCLFVSDGSAELNHLPGSLFCVVQVEIAMMKKVTVVSPSALEYISNS